MKTVIVSGQNHKGSTYHIARQLTDKIGGEVTEFFLPRDFGAFCTGCTSCFMKSETFCPHYEALLPITQAMDEADVLIFASPVYVYHATGAMKAFLDHYGYRWMVHRPEPRMFFKQAVCISTAAGGGMKSTNRDMADSLFFWGVPKIYRFGMAVRAVSYAEITETRKAKIDRETTALAVKIKNNCGHVRPGLRTKGFFYLMRMLERRGWNETDHVYWVEKGWVDHALPWKPAAE